MAIVSVPFFVQQHWHYGSKEDSAGRLGAKSRLKYVCVRRCDD
jgi:hypothetical protein